MRDDDIERLLHENAIKINDKVDPVLKSVRSRDETFSGDKPIDGSVFVGGGGVTPRTGHAASTLVIATVKHIPRGLLPALPRILSVHSAASLIGMWWLLHTPVARELLPSTAVALQFIIQMALSFFAHRQAALRIGVEEPSIFLTSLPSWTEGLYTLTGACLSCASALLLWSSVARLDAAVATVAWEARAAWAGAASPVLAFFYFGSNSARLDDGSTIGLVYWAGISLVAAGCALAEKSNRAIGALETAALEQGDASAELETASFQRAHHTGFALACAAALLHGVSTCVAEAQARHAAESPLSNEAQTTTTSHQQIADPSVPPPLPSGGAEADEASPSQTLPQSPPPPSSSSSSSSSPSSSSSLSSPVELARCAEAKVWRGECRRLLSSALLALAAAAWEVGGVGALLAGGTPGAAAAEEEEEGGEGQSGGEGGGGGGEAIGQDGSSSSVTAFTSSSFSGSSGSSFSNSAAAAGGSLGFFRCYTALTWACVLLNALGELMWARCLVGATVEAAPGVVRAPTQPQPQPQPPTSPPTSLPDWRRHSSANGGGGGNASGGRPPLPPLPPEPPQPPPPRPRGKLAAAVTTAEWRQARAVGGGIAVAGTAVGAALFLGGEGLSPTFLAGATLATYGLLVFGAAAPLPSIDFFVPVGEEEVEATSSSSSLIRNGEFVAPLTA